MSRNHLRYPITNLVHILAYIFEHSLIYITKATYMLRHKYIHFTVLRLM